MFVIILTNKKRLSTKKINNYNVLMLGKYSDIIIELRNSIAKTTCDKFIFHLPIVTAFNNSFFQSSETIEDLKALFFKTLFVSDNENLKINDDKDLRRVRANIFKFINDAQTSEILFENLLNYFRVKKINIMFNPNLSYFGSLSDLLSSRAEFPTLIRENYRIWMYGFDFEGKVNIGKKPIELLESIKFQEFLTLPSSYLYEQ
jgi:hypothetical protein